MNVGRVSEVQRNSVHEAIFTKSIAPVVEAYQPIELLSGAACDRWDAFSSQILTWTHSIQFEPRYVSPFQASLNALSLQWEVCLDNLFCFPKLIAIEKPRCAAGKSTLKLSQRPQFLDVHMKHVRFDDQIDIFLGDEEEFAMGKIQVSQIALLNWPTKPWSKKRIRKQNPYSTDGKAFSYRSKAKQPQEPYSHLSMLSRDCVFCPAEEHQHDTASFVQALHFKQAVHPDQNVDMAAMFGEGRTVPDAFMDHNEESDHESFESESALSRSSVDSRLQQSNLDEARQEVIMFHVGDPPLRVFLDWSNYENRSDQ